MVPRVQGWQRGTPASPSYFLFPDPPSGPGNIHTYAPQRPYPISWTVTGVCPEYKDCRVMTTKDYNRQDIPLMTRDLYARFLLVNCR